MRTPRRSALLVSLLCAACGSGTAAEPPIAVLCGATAPAAADVVVSTLAGNGKPGFVDGTGGPTGTAQFRDPNGVAVDAAGNAYVADYGNHRVRKIDPQGNVTTLAGNGTGGDADGTGGATGTAQLFFPFGLTVDQAGNVVVADSGSSRIRRIDPQGNVVTVAGNGTVGATDGQGGRDGLASFAHPIGVAVDPSGNILVADRDNHRIRRIDKTGAVITLAGTGTMGYRDGPAGQAWFAQPSGIAADSAGNVYVADRLNQRIRRIDPFGNVTTVAGNGSAGYYDGSGGALGCAQFTSPVALAPGPQGVLYVVDTGNHKLRAIDLAKQKVSSYAGTGTQGFADGPGEVAEFSVPSGVAVDAAGTVFVSDNANGRVRVIRPK
jgi:sugar lactone lactonase YvrE